MSTRRESTQPVPSVMARLMGLDDMPTQHPVQKKPRVLSENYLRRISSIGVREKCPEQQSFKFSKDKQDGCKNVLQVLETLRRKKHCTMPVPNRELHVATSDVQSSLQLGHAAVLKSPLPSASREITKCQKFRRKTESMHINASKKVLNGLGVYSSVEHCNDNTNELWRSTPTSRIVVTKPNLGKADIAARCFSLTSITEAVSRSSHAKKNEILIPHNRNLFVAKKERKSIPNGTETIRPRFRFLKERTRIVGHGTSSIPAAEARSGLSGFTKESELSMPSSPSLSVKRRQINCSDGSYMTSEAKKQISERWKTTKKYQEVELPGKYSRINQGGPDFGNVSCGIPLGINRRGSRKNEFGRDLPISRSLLTYFNAVGSPNSRMRKGSPENGEDTRDLESFNVMQNESRNQDSSQKYGSECRGSDPSCKKSQTSHYMVPENNLVSGDYVVQDEQENKLKNGSTVQISAGSLSSEQSNQTLQDTWMKQKRHKSEVKEDYLAENSYAVPKSSTESSLSISTGVVAETQVVKKSCSNYEKHQSESSNCIFSEKEEDSSSLIQDALYTQEISNGTFEEESVSSQCSCTYPESLISSFEEACQPSPNSVLERFFKKDISSCSDGFKSVNASLHELQMQLELLKAETSEGSSMVVSSDDDDNGEGSVIDSEEKQGLTSLFRVQESRDFSYLVDVLTEAGFQNRNLHVSLDALHSQEFPISNSVFEALEKKYGEQISWKRMERRLLFDRINSGLMEILAPLNGPLTQTKPVAWRFVFGHGNETIEEELWMLLVSQEKELSKESQKILGRDDGWMELGDDFQAIGREMENSLIDELVVDISMEIFC